MDHFLLEGWLPILLPGVIILLVIWMLNKKFNSRTVYLISCSFLLASVIALFCSIYYVGGWTGMGIGFYSVSVFIGTLIGIILVALKSFTSTIRFRKIK